MTLLCLMPTNEWDVPFFKVLASNDTGAAPGHQGGIVIPKDLRPYFPGLSEAQTSTVHPTIARRIFAELFVENRFLATADTRYQYQTWGGKRSAESRLTDQLVPLRSLAIGSDVLVIQRSIDRLDHYRLTLVRRSSPEFSILFEATEGRKWGVIGEVPPLSQRDLKVAFAEEVATEQQPFTLLDTAALVVESRVKKVARSVAFRETVSRLYGYTCVVCRTALRSPLGMVELDAAHIVPRSRLGADDARNGIALCKRHHWAFDGGLFGISDDFKLIVPRHVGAIAENASLKAFGGHSIHGPSIEGLAPHRDAIAWHRTNVMLFE